MTEASQSKKQTYKNLCWLLLSIFVILLDRIVKMLMQQHLVLGAPLPITSFFNFTLAYNPGAAFSFLTDAGGWQRWLFIILAVLVSGLLIVWLYRLPRHKSLLATALALVVGGAIGNLWGRIVNGYVIDFLDFHIGTWHWPAFNIADSAICIGVLLLIIDMLLEKR